MGLGSRIGLVFSNMAMLIPVYIMLLASAIIATKARNNIEKLSGMETAKSSIKKVVILLWVLFAGSIIFNFTLGLVIMPWVVNIPYLYGFFLSFFGILNLSVSGVFFYVANEVRISPEYKTTSNANHAEAAEAFKYLLGCGIAMTIAGLLMFVYTIYTIHEYRKHGGLTGDVALVGKYGGQLATAAGQPEFGIPMQAVGGMAEQRLSAGNQQELRQRGGQVQQLGKAYGSAGLKQVFSNPAAMEEFAGIFA